MPVTSIEQPTYLVLDNCVLVMLTEWYCSEHSGVPARQLLDDVQAFLLNQFNLLRRFTVDHLVHTTVLVSIEYKPQGGILGKRGLLLPQLNAMANAIRGQLSAFDADINSILAIKNLPDADRRLVGPIGLTDRDFSLIHRGLDLTRFGQPVLIISNDQDLLQFISWVRNQGCLRTEICNPRLLEGLTCLTYFDLIHRGCSITSEQMSKMINFMILDTANRMNLGNELALSTAKGQRILAQIAALNQEFAKSVAIKAQQQEARA
jgi:hypothetical protein